jgi:hypothetical protein
MRDELTEKQSEIEPIVNFVASFLSYVISCTEKVYVGAGYRT